MARLSPPGQFSRCVIPPDRIAASADLRRASLVPVPRNGRNPVMEHRKTGRPSKGLRRQVRARVPVALFEALHTEAARQGVTVNDLVGEHLSALVGVPYSSQEALSLSA